MARLAHNLLLELDYLLLQEENLEDLLQVAVSAVAVPELKLLRRKSSMCLLQVRPSSS